MFFFSLFFPFFSLFPNPFFFFLKASGGGFFRTWHLGQVKKGSPSSEVGLHPTIAIASQLLRENCLSPSDLHQALSLAFV